MKKLSKNDVLYVENMCKDLVNSLNSIADLKEDLTYLYSSPERARFKRLRVELSKKLMDIQNIIYN